MDLTKGEAPSTEASPERFHVVGKVTERRYVYRWWQAVLIAVGFLALEGVAIGLSVAVSPQFLTLAIIGGVFYVLFVTWAAVLIEDNCRGRVLPRWVLTVEDALRTRAHPGCANCVPTISPLSHCDYVCRGHRKKEIERVLYYGGEKRARKVADKLLASVKAEAVKEAAREAKRQAVLTGYFRIPPD